MDKLLLYALLLCVSIVTTDGGQAETDMVIHFGVLSVRGVLPMKGNCKYSKQPVLTVAQIGGYEEERVVVLRLEYNPVVCPDPPPSDEAIDLDPTALQMYATIPDVGGRHNDSSRKVNGIGVERGRAGGGGGGGGGGGPGGGGEDPGEEGPDDNSDTSREGDTHGDGNERIEAVGEILSIFQKKSLNKLAKISIFIASQTGIALVAIPRDKLTFMVAAFSTFSYFFCLFSIISENQSVAAITGAIGTLFAAVGFLLVMCMIVFPSSV